MTKRKILIFFSQDGKELTHESAARSWGELRDELSTHDFGSKKVVDRETRHVFEVDEAVLPEGEFVLYIYPKKSKGGAATASAFKKITPDKIHTYPVDTIRKFGAYLNKTHNAAINVKAAKEALNKEVRKWMLKNNWPEAVATSSPGKASKSSKKIEKELLGKIGGSSRASAPSVEVNVNVDRSVGKSKKAGPATLDIIDDKLDIVIELLKARTAPRTAVPASTDSKDLAEDARRLKEQLHGVQG